MPESFPGAEDITRLIGRMIVGSDQSNATKLSRAERKAQGAAETVRAKVNLQHVKLFVKRTRVALL